LLGAAELPRGARVRLRLGRADEIALDIAGTVIERLDGDGAAAGDDATEDDDAQSIAGPIAVVMALDDADPPATAATTDDPVGDDPGGGLAGTEADAGAAAVESAPARDNLQP